MAPKPKASAMLLPMPIWDLPVRLFHWMLPVLLIVSYVSVKKDMMTLHFLSGYTMAALLIFRIAWGFVGSETARFSHFVKSPLAALRHLTHFFRRGPDTQVGHNEAGGWMVVVLLAVLVVQVATGLCANDDGTTEGPLMKHISKELSDRLSLVHEINFKLLLAIVAGHLAAVIGYAVFRGHDLVRPMVTGRKRLPAATPAPAMVHPLAALVILAVAAAVMFAVARYV
ncbi:MAG: cytochrome b/b6 domain-containing protein [Alphaproteobacteria bacterium]|nr:cytochrome b/b6 domain-containing protein [Alphaproteobacteria bacterium]